MPLTVIRELVLTIFRRYKAIIGVNGIISLTEYYLLALFHLWDRCLHTIVRNASP